MSSMQLSAARILDKHGNALRKRGKEEMRLLAIVRVCKLGAEREVRSGVRFERALEAMERVVRWGRERGEVMEMNDSEAERRLWLRSRVMSEFSKRAMVEGISMRLLWCRMSDLMSVVLRIGSRSNGVMVSRFVDERSRIPAPVIGHVFLEGCVGDEFLDGISLMLEDAGGSSGRMRFLSSFLISSVVMVKNRRSLSGLFETRRLIKLSIRPISLSRDLRLLQARSRLQSFCSEVNPSGSDVILLFPAERVIRSGQSDNLGRSTTLFSETLSTWREGNLVHSSSSIHVRALWDTLRDFMLENPFTPWGIRMPSSRFRAASNSRSGRD